VTVAVCDKTESIRAARIRKWQPLLAREKRGRRRALSGRDALDPSSRGIAFSCMHRAIGDSIRSLIRLRLTCLAARIFHAAMLSRRSRGGLIVDVIVETESGLEIYSEFIISSCECIRERYATDMGENMISDACVAGSRATALLMPIIINVRARPCFPCFIRLIYD